MNIDYHKCEACGIAKVEVDEALELGQKHRVQIDELVQKLLEVHNKTSGLEAFFQKELLKMKAQRDEARAEAEKLNASPYISDGHYVVPWLRVAPITQGGE